MNKKKKFEIEDTEFRFEYQKNNLNLKIDFNRVSFIFFIFFVISLIFSIHLIHLGSRNNGSIKILENSSSSNKLFRADIIDRNGKYIVKTVSSINVGINPSQVIDKKKLLINLRFIFPEKNFSRIEKKLDNGKFFWLEKKYQMRNTKK